MTDYEILQSIYQDAAKGMTLLINTYADLVYKVVYEVLSDVGRQEDIEDCVSDTFTAFFDNIDDVDLSRGSIKGFLGVIARRRAVNLRYTLRPDDESSFDEYTVEEMSDILEKEEVLKSPGLSDIIIRRGLKEIAPEEAETEETEEDISEEVLPQEKNTETGRVIIREKTSRFGRVLKTAVSMILLVTVITVGVIAFDRFNSAKQETTAATMTTQPTTQPTTQSQPYNPLLSAIISGNESLIESLIGNSLLLTQDVLQFAIESADKISYDSIRRIAEEVRKKYGSTGLDPILEGAIFGDFQSVEKKLKNKDESEMTPAEKMALFFITTFDDYAGQ